MFIRIPAERIAVLIGKDGGTKKMVEKATHTAIEVEENMATVTGEALAEINTIEIIRAIGRGFSPENAIKLLSEEYILSVIRLDITKKAVKRVMKR